MYLVEFEIPGATREQYEKIWEILAAKGALAPAGRRHHFGAPIPGGWHVTDVWTDLAELDRFGKILVPAMIEAGITPGEPRVLPVVKVVDA